MGPKFLQSTLFTQSLDKVVSNLELYPIDDIKLLPNHIKNRILKRTLRTQFLMGSRERFNEIISALAQKDVVKLNLSHIPVNDDLLEIVGKCHNLREFTLNLGSSSQNKSCMLYYSTFTKKGLIKLLYQLKNLCHLTIMNSIQCDNDVLEIITKTCPQLSSLDVSGCCNINDEGIALLASLANLKWVSFSRTLAGHEGISKFLEGSSSKELLELRIDDCVNVTDATLRKITDCCPKLQVLSFYNCDSSTSKVDTLSTSFGDKRLKDLKHITWTLNW